VEIVNGIDGKPLKSLQSHASMAREDKGRKVLRRVLTEA